MSVSKTSALKLPFPISVNMQFSTRLHLLARPLLSSSLLHPSRQNGFREIMTRIGVNTCSLSTTVSAEASDLECDAIHDDVKAAEKNNALCLAVSQLASEFSKESMLSLQKFFRVRYANVVSTGSLKLDIALGIGGLPKGRIVEIYGREAAGKTTLALQIIKEAQKLGGYCAYLDVESALDLSLVESMGVNTKNLLISNPDCAENLLSMVDTLTKSGAVDVIVVDSVAALVPKCELDQLGVATNQDLHSRIMTQALRKIHYSLSRSQTLLIFVNQVRFSPKAFGGRGPMEEVTCGGNALRFYAAVRLRLSRMGLIKTEDKVEGITVCAQVVKNKLAPAAMKKAELGIKFGRGFCQESEVFDLACEHGLIMKCGGKDKIRNIGSNDTGNNVGSEYNEVEGRLEKVCVYRHLSMSFGGVAFSLVLWISMSVVSSGCSKPAVIFMFGDSNSDTGGLVSGLGFPVNLPNGRTFFHRSTGRLSDGRLVIDFLCQSLNTRFLTPYLDSMSGSTFTNGANFAVVGSSTLPKYLPFSLNIQVMQFQHFKARSLQLATSGAKNMINDQGFRDALYLIDIGQNDLADSFTKNLSYVQVTKRVPTVITEIENAVKSLYNEGGRKFWVHNTGPFGCLPKLIALSQKKDLDSFGCLSSYNSAARLFNEALYHSSQKLRSELKDATLVYVDIYAIKNDLITNATKYGFANPLMVCCGFGGPPYNFDARVTCGQPGYQVCDEGSRYVSWDGIHFTEAANTWIASKILSTAYSTPHIPFGFFCH